VLTFPYFSYANRARIPAFGNGQGHSIQELALCIAEEAGEIAAAVLGATGAKKRKAHLTAKDVVDECADAITYLDLMIQELGYHTDDVLIDKFNRVSVRANSTVRISTDGWHVENPYVHAQDRRKAGLSSDPVKVARKEDRPFWQVAPPSDFYDVPDPDESSFTD